jgi:acyl-CoA synthetase (NDP forming)
VTASSLDPLFKPRSIAVIGASTDATKIGGRPVHYLKQYFKGPIYPVNPRADDVQGLKSYAAASDLPEGVDQAVVCLPAELVVPTLEQCVERGVKSACIFSSGFAEIGQKGRDLQNRITEISRESGMRILGPNCLGIMNIAGIEGDNGEALGQSINTFTIAVEENPPKPGNIGIVSQSGAFAAHAYTLAARRGLGLSAWATTGNDCDVEFSDCLAYLATDPATDVIMGYMEGCQDRDKLFEALALARENEKPMVIVKVGASEVGQKAAASHTAVLSGGDAIFDSVFKQYGVHRAHTIDEFFDVAYAASFKKFPSSKKFASASISGGVGILMADRAIERGLDVAPMPEIAAKKLKEVLPYAGVGNPVDVTAQIISQPELLEKNLDIMLTDGGYDAIVVFLTNVFYSEALRGPMFETFKNVRAHHPDALITLCSFIPPDIREELEALGYILIDEPTRAVDAMAALAGYKETFAQKSVARAAPSASAKLALPGHALNEYEAKQLLGNAGFPVIGEKLVTSPEAASMAAKDIGYPVALKIASADIQHKSEIGGVVLGLNNDDQVEAAFDDIMERAGKAEPNAKLDGVIVAAMAPKGVEAILGTSQDPVFGPVVMFGLGGIFVEVMKDVTFRVAPFDLDEAHKMIGEIKGAAILDGARGLPPADKEALAQALVTLSEIAAANADSIESIDLNPFIVHAKGQGATAVDALIVKKISSNSFGPFLI